MEEYKPNSHKYKAEQAQKESEDKTEKKLEKVIDGKATVRKKSEARKWKDVFISDDVHNVKSYVVMDVLVPAIKKAVSDIVTNGIEMILYGETGRNRSRSRGDTVSYRSFYDSRDDRRDRDTRYSRTGYSYDDIVLETRGEAEKVLDKMYEILDMYKIVSVADLLDICDLPSQYTDNKYGWTNLRHSEAIRVRDGYMLKLPKPLPIQ